MTGEELLYAIEEGNLVGEKLDYIQGASYADDPPVSNDIQIARKV
jgi:hypothetical protein